MSRVVEPKSLGEICNEWDSICKRRQRAISEGRDISLIHVTTPCIIRHLRIDSPARVLDVGCGTGYLTSVASKYVQVCVGIDLSKESISLARQCYSDSKTSFFVAEISKFSSMERFDVCMANMVFMSDPNWKESLINIYELLNTNGYLYVMITHPCFWPKYAKLENVSGFDYSKELFIENDFSISLEKYMGKSTYIHRPLSQYFAGLLTSGFEICSVEEPFPTEKAQFDNEYEYQYPRFLFIKCKKQNLSHMF